MNGLYLALPLPRLQEVAPMSAIGMKSRESLLPSSVLSKHPLTQYSLITLRKFMERSDGLKN